MVKFDAIQPTPPPDDPKRKFTGLQPLPIQPSSQENSSQQLGASTGPIEVIPRMDGADLGKNFLGASVREVTALHIATQDILTNFPPEHIEAVPFHGGMIIFAADGTWVAMSCPSEEAIHGQQPNQDRAGVLMLDENHILFVQADGVGQSVDAQNSSGYAVRQIIENGTENMANNLEFVATLMKEAHLMHDPAEKLPNLMAIARAETKKSQGSNTTLNQYKIKRDRGIITTNIAGDGNVMMVRVNGTIERSVVGGHQQRLTTRRGLEARSGEITVFPKKGDVAVLTSDGMADITNEQLTLLKDLFLAGKREEYMAELERIIMSLHDDDRTMFMTIHQGENVGE